MMRIEPAAIPIGHSIRSGIAVGGPFVIGSLTGHVLIGMWIGLATLLLAAGEREGTYRLNFRIIAISTPIAACGYLLGFVQNIPLAALIPVMAAVALLAGLIAGFGPEFSVAGMQFLLVASIAIGVDGIDWWTPIWLYLVGGALYAALLAIEMLVEPRRPQRIVLVALLQSLADLATARIADLADPEDRNGSDRTGRARIAATTAHRNAAGRVSEVRVHRMGSAGDWSLDADVVGAADRVQALVLASTDTSELAAVGGHLTDLAGSVGRRQKEPTPPPTVVQTSTSPLCRRVRALDHALGGTHRSVLAPRRGFTFHAIGSEVVFAAVRLSLCFGIAVGAKAYFPFSHWFWVPLTVCLVMKPDFGSVFDRAILRVVGTVIGVAIATGVILLVPKGWEIGVAIGLLSACVPWFMMRSYALQAVAIAPVVILLVDVISPGDSSANDSWQRIGATVVGGLVVIVFGYLIWPHSRRAWVAETFATAMSCIATHLRIAATAVPEDAGAARRRHDELVAARRDAYRALSDLQTRMQRASAEPPPAGTTAMAWIPVATATGRLADAVTVYAGQRLAGTYPPDADRAAVLAERIVGLGSGDGLDVTCDRDSDAAGSVDRGSELNEIDDELSRLRGLLERT
ncbi:hypothetical protein GYA93_05355 [Gordonia desulfuricans]|uniref:FUSC family protein n=1 Tax=Gordonia desulfuricans TaxID=89051 RepID=A0A7K3LL79_9ACTN|nr:FUSC family protein [Gordonia desulfuricans]NDK89009.1 hypothetical protein [Gordonia desulfuricans]